MPECVIRSLWVGDRLTPLEQIGIASFLHHGHDFHLYAYDDVQDLPAGVVVKDGARVLPPDSLFKERELGSYAAFSNIFRYKLLLETGGIWCDADMLCVKPWRLSRDFVFSEQRTPDGGTEVNGNVVKVPAGSAIMEYCLAEASRMSREGFRWGQMGPALLTAAIERFGLSDMVVPARAFNPLDYWKVDWLYSPTVRDRLRLQARLAWRVYGLHLWHSVWTRREADPDRTYPWFCLYESLKRKYLRDRAR